MSDKIKSLINEYKSTDNQKRYYRLKPPGDIQGQNTLKRWQPKRLTVRQGILETPFPILVGYTCIVLLSILINLAAVTLLPEKITLVVMFGLGQSNYYTLLLCLAGISIQLYLIYRDIVRRSISSYLLVIPGVFFAMNVLLVIQNI